MPGAHAAGGRGRRRAVRLEPVRDPAGRRRWRLSAEAEVHAGGPDEWADGVAAVVARAPRITLDDGADLLGALHAARPDLLDGMLGGTEETTTGLVRLRALEADGRADGPGDRRQRGARRAGVQRPLRRRPVGARRHRARDQPAARRARPSSCSATAGRAAASRCARTGFGASVIVCEVDPLRALEARMEGFAVMPALEAAERGDIFITVTGVPGRAARRALRAHEGRRGAGQRGPVRRRDLAGRPARGGRRACARSCRWSSATSSATAR